MPNHPRRGFTLIELMVAIGIMTVILGLGAGGWMALSARVATRNAAIDLTSALHQARTTAVQNSSDVWFIVYPKLAKAGGSAGQGAYFIFEDPDSSFAAGGARNWSNFAPPSAIDANGGKGKLLEAVYFESYPRKNTSLSTPTSPVAFPAPFAGLTEAACSFCSGTPPRGAIVFDGNGAARFFDNAGPVTLRTGGLVVRGDSPPSKFLFAVSGPTGLISTWSK